MNPVTPIIDEEYLLQQQYMTICYKIIFQKFSSHTSRLFFYQIRITHIHGPESDLKQHELT